MLFRGLSGSADMLKGQSNGSGAKGVDLEHGEKYPGK